MKAWNPWEGGPEDPAPISAYPHSESPTRKLINKEKAQNWIHVLWRWHPKGAWSLTLEKNDKPGEIEKRIIYAEIMSTQGGGWLAFKFSGNFYDCLYDFEWGIDFNSKLTMAHRKSILRISFPETGVYFYVHCTCWERAAILLKQWPYNTSSRT